MSSPNGYIEIKKKLLKMISDLKPDTRLESRSSLSQNFNVSKATVDRAVSELIGEGYLYSKDKSGTYISILNNTQKHKGNLRQGSWALIIPNIMNDTYPGILRGVEDVASDVDINVIICNTDNDEKKQNRYIDNLLESDVSGVIIIPSVSGHGDTEPFFKLKQGGIPFVFCNRLIYSIEAPCVCSNNYFGAYIATRRLFSQGYKNVAYISRPIYATSIERYQGYRAALVDSGITYIENHTVFEDEFNTERTGYKVTKDLLKRYPDIDSIFAFNDVVAVGSYEAAIEAGKKVGHDFGIVGYDNTKICETFQQKLTSVNFKNYEIGKIAANLLKEIIEGKKANRIVILEPELVIRESCSKD